MITNANSLPISGSDDRRRAYRPAVKIAEQAIHRHGSEIGVCGTCMDARGIAEGELAQSARRGTLEQLTDWTLWADQTLVF